MAAPDFTLQTGDGTPISLGVLRGAPVIVYFYPKDDTSGCTLEAQQFTEQKHELRKLGATVVGISPDDCASHRKFSEKYGLDVVLAADEDHAVADAYGVWAEKSMYGKTYMGIERSTFLIGKDGRIVRSWRKVKVPGHVEEVLGALKDLVG